MSAFPPIAVVGQGCVLPGAMSPSALWALVHERRSAIAPVEPGAWGTHPRARTRPAEIASSFGGSVTGFTFDARGLHLPEEALARLDPVFGWTIHAAREALIGAGLDPRDRHPRAALVLGNLSYPTRGLADLALEVWRREKRRRVDPRNRFMSGLPAHLAAEALGLGAGAFALDAACASSLYAIKLACDRLHDGSADLVLAGGVNAADDLCLHLGFTALRALSPTGQSRPFHRAADGLVPAQGAALVALERLEDARARGHRVLAVIRAAGLANDGRTPTLLTPVEGGQIRAMRAAYAMSGVRPEEISLLECHATGTALGDAVEVRSVREVFGAATDLPLGSLKSNLGHMITASGAAALIKVVEAMKAGVRPATLSAEEPLDELSRGGPLRVLAEEEPWTSRGPRRAGINNFGFGGNDAHLIVEEDDPAWRPKPVERGEPAEIAVVARAVIAGAGTLEPFELDVSWINATPSDLKESLPQQILLLRAAHALAGPLSKLAPERTGLVVGMQCDAEVARYAARWRTPAEGTGPTTSAGVLGTMPNVVANRLSRQLGLEGPSFTVSSEEASGTVALELAARSLARRELDAALVGAVDLSAEPVAAEAAERVLAPALGRPGDAAVLLLLKRLEDARGEGDPILAVLTSDPSPAGLTVTVQGVAAEHGHAHAASGLLAVAEAVRACETRSLMRGGEPPRPWLPLGGKRIADVPVRALGGQSTRARLAPEPGYRGAPIEPPPILEVFEADSASALIRRIRDRDRGQGGLRLAVVSKSAAEHAQRLEATAARLAAPDLRAGELAPGVYFGDRAIGGETAFVFGGPAAAYRDMGRDLALGFPELVDRLSERFTSAHEIVGWIYDREDTSDPLPEAKLWGASFLAQLHALVSRGVLGLAPEASIGYCAGETNALFALGAWSDLEGLRRAIDASAMFGRELAGELRAVKRAWRSEQVAWGSWRVKAPLADVRAALAGEPRVHLAIINDESDVVICGDPAGLARVGAQVGMPRTRSVGYDFVMHCPEAREFERQWHEIHDRPTAPVPGVRFYTHATCGAYELSRASAASALTGQAMGLVDFPALIRRAWDDGVRVFVEHGPQAGCTRWISRILEGREHVAVALDHYGRSSLLQIHEAVARLHAAGVRVDHGALTSRLAQPAEARRPSEKRPLLVTFPAHWPAPRVDEEPQLMPPAPKLPAIASLESPPAPAHPMPTHPSSAHASTPHASTPHASTPHASTASPMTAFPAPAHPSTPLHAPVHPLAAHHEALAALHVEFLRQQHAVHARFMALLLGAQPPHLEPAQPPHAEPAQPPHAEPEPAQPPHAEHAHPPMPAPGRPVRFSRADLEVHASGKISAIFGERFLAQDPWPRQVRMPEPPLLLADRVTRIEGEPATMGTGTIWTETDVAPDAWYLHEGRMPAAIMVESGQADLMLISWLGADLLNRGERVYRLLGCELTCHGGLAEAGDTLAYEIHVDGHARQGDVRLFFFHYDCTIGGKQRMTVRNGQAGFFTDEELASSAGVLWSAEDDAPPTASPRLDPPIALTTKRSFDARDIDAFVERRVSDCFGPGFERADTHTLTPVIQGGRMRLFDEVTTFDPAGGPWGRGYLRARLALSPSSWFFDGHFKNDPCMPGTLMFEGALETMATYMAALGFTLPHDGWRFEPVPEETYRLRCRGQATPRSKEVVYELFVDEIVAGPCPTLYADLLGTVDGLKAFYVRRMGLRLVPAWPLDPHRLSPDHIQRERPADRPAASAGGLTFDYDALLACAWGRPSHAFGAPFRAFDGPRRLPRLPGPPYHFMSRVVNVEGEIGAMQVGSAVEVEYDVPPDAWYFRENAAQVMPFAVLLEVALQPCGWLACYVGTPLTRDEDLCFRNLDGTGTVHAEVRPDAGTLLTRTRLRAISAAGPMVIVSFDVTVRQGATPIYTLATVFGFFPGEAMKNQLGLPTGDAQRARLAEPGPTLALPRPDPSQPRIAGDMLLMLDRVSGVWPDGGEARLGRIRVEKDVVARDWFFRAHFMNDPVQPGSLGLEAMLQALQILMIRRGAAEGLRAPRFTAIHTGAPMTWKYRGQVVPENRVVTVELEITREGRDDSGAFAFADASLWVDEKRIYEAKDLGMRVVDGP